MPRLIVIKGTDEGKQFALTGDLLQAGRDSSSPVRLTDTEVSRRHAEFVRTPDGAYRVRDVGSANGTFVNNQSVRDVLLQPGDHVQIGQTIMVYTPDVGASKGPASDLADKISLITRQDGDLASAIVKTIGETEGSRILSHPEQVEGPWLKNALANLGALYEVTQTMSHTLDLEQLLERIMDVIFRSLDADRGCVMLRGPGALEGADGARLDVAHLEPRVLRWRDQARRQEKVPVSRTIMDHVLREKEGILVSDAARDERFQAVQSVVRAGIREVICVPMRGRHETMGVLYLDTTTSHVRLAASGQTGKFNEEHLKLAGAIAHQAALAVEETRYYQAMVNAERLAAVGQTVAALSHHIKNILHGLQWGGQMVDEGLRDDDGEMLRTGWRIVKTNQGKVQELVKDMLTYSKDREPVLETTDLNEVAREVVELLEGRARELGAQLTTRLDEGLPKASADREGIHRALLNIVSNALDAVEEAEQPRVLVASSREQGGEWLRLQVRDNGPGIAPEKQAEIFRPFVSSKGARGTGLGLAVSRKILREHGGDITVQSQAGQGSLFTLRLPHKGPNGQDMQSTRTEIPVAPPPD